MIQGSAGKEKEKKAVTACEPTVLLDTDEVVFINKPAGLLTHADGRQVLSTVVDWVLTNYPAVAGVGEVAVDQSGEAIDRSGIVHRLDRETSGVMVIAKTAASFNHLKHQFQEQLVRKEYRAFVYGRINDRWGTINRPIGRSTADPRKRSAERGATGVLREAVTDFERIGLGEYLTEPFSYVKLVPQTGRTHQLRAHLRALDRPIVGDELYADYKYKIDADGSMRSNHLACERLMLHAHSLELTLPTGESKRIIAPLPLEFELAAERLEGTV